MIAFGGVNYFIDLKALNKFITISEVGKPYKETELKETYEDGKLIKTEKFERSSPQAKEIDDVKYEMVRTFIEYLMDYEYEADDSLGAERALNKTDFAFRMVFNTLMAEKILIEVEE